MELLLNCSAKNLFQVLAQRFNRERAARMVAKRFDVSIACVERCAYYW